MSKPLAFVLVWLLVVSLHAQERANFALVEKFAPDVCYHVSCRVQIDGKLKVPAKALDVVGQSVIEYDERVLSLSVQGEVERALRQVSRMDFERSVAGDTQKNSLRAAVKRLVLLRQGNVEVPFSPDAPMKFGEIDLVRTDVFTPALAGLLPRDRVRIGDGWKANDSAVRELTDLHKITQGDLTCTFDKLDETGGCRLAKIAFHGTIDGVGENGPTRHELEGFYYFDLQSHMLSYLSLKGTEVLSDEKGMAHGRVAGTFVLTREPRPIPHALGAGAAHLTLTPNETNTRLLFEDDETGLRFVHSRRWRARADGLQIKLDDHRGNGVLLTVETLSRLPTVDQFRREVGGWLSDRKAKVVRHDAPRVLQRQPTHVESFTVEAETPDVKGTRNSMLHYAVIRDRSAGATLAATFVTSDRAQLQRDVEQLAVEIRVGR